MKKNNSLLLVTILFIGVFSSITYWIGINQQSAPSHANTKNWKNIEFVLDHLMSSYVDTIDANTLSQKAIANILKELDPHSTYIPANERQRVNEALVGHFGGVGIRFMILRDTLTVVDVIKNGPSFKMGIEKRDRIIEINNENVASTGLTNNQVLKKLKGAIGSEVSLSVLKTNKSIERVTVQRDLINLNSLSAFCILKDSVGYIKINNFSNSTDTELSQALRELISIGMENLILDLRFNGGGYLHQAINVADEFLNKGLLIVYTEGAHSQKREFFAQKNGAFEKGEIIILVNSSTASASEIVSGAIQDHNRGRILGRRTFGKGLVQQPILLVDSSELRITTSRYYTPSGKCIQKPYGENIDYENDILKRLEDGELTNVDLAEDSITQKGGIWPDIFSPIDTLIYNKLVSEITYTRAWRDFCFDFFESNPNKPAPSLRSFYETYKVNKGILEDYFDKMEIEKRLLTDEVYVELNWNLQLELSSYYYGEQARYIISAYRDNDVKKALTVLSK